MRFSQGQHGTVCLVLASAVGCVGWVPTAASATLSVKSDHSNPVVLANKFNLKGENTLGARLFFFFFNLFTLFKMQIVLIRAVDKALRLRGSHCVSRLISS